MKIESRKVSSNYTTEGNRLVGYAAVFNSPTQITEGGRSFVESVRPGAFRSALASGKDVIATFNHNPDNLLGRTSSGTLRLAEDNVGLRFELELPAFASDIRELVSRGDLNGASFSFAVRAGGEKWADRSTRELTDLDLFELGPVSMPAYSSTSLGMRGNIELAKLRLQLISKYLD